MIYLLIIASLLLTTLGQVLQKKAAVKANEIDCLNRYADCFVKMKETWLAIVSLGTGLLVWLVVLRYMDVSKAVPFLSINYVLVLMASRYYFREEVVLARRMGAVLIGMGAAMVGMA